MLLTGYFAVINVFGYGVFQHGGKMKVGITFSTFDLLHAGPVAMLREAKSKCDYLIVGLQSRSQLLYYPDTKKTCSNKNIPNNV